MKRLYDITRTMSGKRRNASKPVIRARKALTSPLSQNKGQEGGVFPRHFE